jgi:hypothetical protein
MRRVCVLLVMLAAAAAGTWLGCAETGHTDPGGAPGADAGLDVGQDVEVAVETPVYLDWGPVGVPPADAEIDADVGDADADADVGDAYVADAAADSGD